MNTKMTLAAAALLAGLAAVPGLSQPPRAFHGMKGFGGFESGAMVNHISVVLDLTEAQKQFAQKLVADTKAQAEPLVAQLRQGHEELAAAVKANNTANINNITTRQGNVVGQLASLHAKAMASFYAQLTPEQKAKAEKLHDQMKERRESFLERLHERRQNQ